MEVQDQPHEDIKRADAIFKDFSEEYGNKYDFGNPTRLGIGAYGAVFKVKEIARNIDIAVKVHTNGITPKNADRGWTISTVARNPQIAQTYTIEEFNDHDGRKCQAVISQFVPGISLAKVLDYFDSLPEPERKIIIEDFAFSLVPSLLQIINYCHFLGYGHGDLHEGNIMVHLSDIDKRYVHNVVLIDFDNASIETEVYAPTEQAKIDSDKRLLTKIIINILRDWEHMPSVKILLDNYNSAHELQTGYGKLLEFIDISETSQFTESSINMFLKTLFTTDIPRRQLTPLLNSLALIAQQKNKRVEFQFALEEFDKAYQLWEETEDMRTELTFIYNAETKEKIYSNMFN